MHKSLLNIGIAAVLVLLLVCCGAAAGENGYWTGDVFYPNLTGYTTAEALADELGTSNATWEDNTVTLLNDVKLGRTLKLGNSSEETPLILDLNGTVLSRNSTSSLSVITVDENKFLNLTDTHPEAEHKFTIRGDGLWILDEYSGTVTVTGGVITGGNISGSGGGVLNAGTFTMSGGNIIGNTATGGCGGGVSINKNGNFTMYSGNIIGNTATNNGGGVYVYSSSEFTMYGGNITGNTATNNGGGVYISSFKTFKMQGGTIGGLNDGDENTATDGGGVYVYYGTFEMSSTASIITGNKATQNGGGVYVAASGTFTMKEGASITGNTANSNGGGVFNGGAFFNVSGTPVISGNTKGGEPNNVYLNTNKKITISGALTSGAKIWVNSTAGADLGTSFTSGWGAHAGLSDSPSSIFTADGQPYAVVVNTSDSELMWKEAVARVVNDTVIYYYANVSAAVAADASTKQTITMIDNSTEGTVTVNKQVILNLNGFVLNHTGSGSVIKIESNGNLTLKDSKPTVEHKFSVDDDGLWKLNNSGDKTIYGGVITGGIVSGQEGGGVHVETSGNFTMNGGNIVGNEATIPNDVGSGGVFVTSGTFTMNNGSIIGNRAGNDGGGVLVTWSYDNAPLGTFIMNGGEITNNIAMGTSPYNGGRGGGVNIWVGTFTMTGGKIKGNEVGGNGYGGGVHLNWRGNTFNMTGGTISENSAKYGGGVCVGGDSQEAIIFNLTNGEITNNTATENGGGVFVNNNGIFKVSGTPKISGNKNSTAAANNVYLANGKFITVINALRSGADVGIINASDAAFAQGYSGYTVTVYDAQYFHHDTNDALAAKVENTTKTGEESQLVWAAKVTVTFDMQGHGTQISPVSIGKGSTVPEQEKPTADGWNFGGWYNETECTNAWDFTNYTVTADTTLYAKWTANSQPAPSSGSSRNSGASVWLPAASSDTQGAQITHTITAQYAGHTFVGVSAGDASDLGSVSPEIAAAAEIKISTAKAAGIKVTNAKGAPALILTTAAAEGLDTVTFSEVYDIKPTNPNEKLTQVTVTVPKADVVASGLTTDDVTIYHFLEAYDLWVPLDTLQITEDEANYFFTAATDGASPFGVLIKKFSAEPAKPTQTPASTPAPAAGIIAGLGAAALVFGLRRK